MAQYRQFTESASGRHYRVGRLTLDVAGYRPIKQWVLVPVTEWGGPDGGGQMASLSRFIPINPTEDCRSREAVEIYVQRSGIMPVTGGGQL
jgi:hypothetical protein